MSLTLRVILVLGAIFALGVVVRRVRRRKIRVADSVYWVVCAVILVLFALFPGIAFFFSGLLGFVSPSNFVLVTIIALMLLKVFNLSCEVSHLDDKVSQLAQEIGLDRNERDEGK